MTIERITKMYLDTSKSSWFRIVTSLISHKLGV